MSNLREKVVSFIFLTASAVALVTAFCAVLDFTSFLSLPNFYTQAKVVQNTNSR